ncbi:hypothetical protein [Oscillibacter sp.]|uniref:hypothetical protein n=1 Tax=Oscillibacter sp. TaxID=1945593 RepID=UPI00257B1B1C|nr:hypothetical protein [Oscillibacter sp.]
MTRAEFAARLKNACAAVTAAEAELTEIDSKFGDADHGLTIAKIAGAISEAVDAAEGIQSMLDDAAMAVMTLNGGSAVPCGTPGWTACRRRPQRGRRSTWRASRPSSPRPWRSWKICPAPRWGTRL